MLIKGRVMRAILPSLYAMNLAADMVISLLAHGTVEVHNGREQIPFRLLCNLSSDESEITTTFFILVTNREWQWLRNPKFRRGCGVYLQMY